MATSDKAQKDVSALQTTVKATLDLIDQFDSSLGPQSSDERHVSQQDIKDPLLVLESSASLTKAQTTKLSLLVINKPFTPSAITTVTRDLSTAALPMMVSAALSVKPEEWGTTFSREVRSRVRRILREMRELLSEVLAIASPAPPKGGSGRDSLASTGVVWAACDALTELKKLGLGGLLAQKALEQQEMLQDAITELDEWSKEPASPPASSHSSVHSDDDGVNAGESSVQDMDFFFAASNALPQGDTKLRGQLADTLKRLNLIKMLYKAVARRRLLTLPSPSETPSTEGSEAGSDAPGVSSNSLKQADTMLHHFETISSETDDLANAFYELDGEEAEEQLRNCTTLAGEVAGLAEKNWDGRGDEFSTWLKKWRDMLRDTETQ